MNKESIRREQEDYARYLESETYHANCKGDGCSAEDADYFTPPDSISASKSLNRLKSVCELGLKQLKGDFGLGHITSFKNNKKLLKLLRSC